MAGKEDKPLRFKEEAIFLAEIFELNSMTAAVWYMTDWGIGRVMFGGIVLTVIASAAVYLGLYAAMLLQKRRRRSRIEQIRQERRRRVQCRIYDLQGELVEIPIPGSDMVEIRNVVAEAKENILQPTKAMQDVI